MCGRYTLTYSGDEIAKIFRAMATPDLFEQPRYNVAPTQSLPIVVQHRDGRRQLRLMRWGLVPRWADDVAIGNRLINARAETAADRPAFRESFRNRRCLVPADGFYEWRKAGRASQPFHLHLADGKLFAFAALWDRWRDPAWEPDAPPLETFTILTTDANDTVRDIHHRMPVIVPPDDWPTWLDPSVTAADTLQPLLRPWPHRLDATAVTPHVNSPRHDDPHCLDPLMFPPA